MKTVNQIREAFLNYFADKGHQIVQSSPLIPHNDPTLMFVNAGMVPFKNAFTGTEKRDYTRATSSQKCVRAGGKHNDLDNVGYTARHHTFFEMLGNFSFGDYFKEDAITYGWDFLTKTLGIDESKLSVTVYHDDDEAYNIWKKVTNLPDERILRISTNDNFWSMGDTGPCGPCSEIFYDHGADADPSGQWAVDENGEDLFGDRFIEIWNLVFMQYEQVAGGKRIDLPKPSIDTGMGLERIAAVLQGKHDNYDIDLMQALIQKSIEVSGNSEHIVSHRVIADHLRSSSFLLADGVMPSNEGRGYVLRRIMRRAMRHAHQIGCKQPLMYHLVPELVKQMGAAYPELVRAESLIIEMLKLEEERFKQTLERGLKLLDGETSSLTAGDVLSGEVAFKLYDTYGFPYDLTSDILRAKDITVDEAGFNAEMQKQKERARAAWKGSGEKATDEIWFDIKEQNGSTEFLGYDSENAAGNIIAIIVDGEVKESAENGTKISVLLNQTPFYGESGGQDGDKGTIKIDENNIVRIDDTKKVLGSLHVHQGEVIKGKISKGNEVAAEVDKSRRDKLRANHSATHILHAVIRNVLGNHVTQKGSLVAEDKLRFDISHPKAISRDEMVIIERKVNEIIRNNTNVATHLMSPDEAIDKGAMALFGEKYGDEVRVVSMGIEDYSVELCGGTHVRRTGDIGTLKVISEGAIAAGIRRIEALTGDAAMQYCNEQEYNLLTIADKLKVSPNAISERIDGLLADRKSLERELTELRKESAMSGQEKQDVNGITFIGQSLENIPPKDLRSVVTDIAKGLDSGIVAVASSFGGKAAIIVSVTDDLTERFKAPDLVRIGAEATGGKGGGGKPNFAQAGGPDGSKTGEAVNAIKDKISAV